MTPPRGVAKNPSLRSTSCCFSREQTEQVSVIILGKLMGTRTIGHRGNPGASPLRLFALRLFPGCSHFCIRSACDECAGLWCTGCGVGVGGWGGPPQGLALQKVSDIQAHVQSKPRSAVFLPLKPVSLQTRKIPTLTHLGAALWKVCKHTQGRDRIDISAKSLPENSSSPFLIPTT